MTMKIDKTQMGNEIKEWYKDTHTPITNLVWSDVRNGKETIIVLSIMSETMYHKDVFRRVKSLVFWGI